MLWGCRAWVGGAGEVDGDKLQRPSRKLFCVATGSQSTATQPLATRLSSSLAHWLLASHGTSRSTTAPSSAIIAYERGLGESRARVSRVAVVRDWIGESSRKVREGVEVLSDQRNGPSRPTLHAFALGWLS